MRSISGLAAFEACKGALLDEVSINSSSPDELTAFYRLLHAFIGVLAESRCFTAFAFWAGFFGKVEDEAVLARMRKIGDCFMDTHNKCWGAWAALGKDHICQPEEYLGKFIQIETRRQLAAFIDIFRANDEKAISILAELL